MEKLRTKGSLREWMGSPKFGRGLGRWGAPRREILSKEPITVVGVCPSWPRDRKEMAKSQKPWMLRNDVIKEMLTKDQSRAGKQASKHQEGKTSLDESAHTPLIFTFEFYRIFFFF